MRREGFPNVSAEQRREFLRSTLDVLPGAQGVSGARGALERPLLVVMGGTLLLLLLASLNVAGLFLARGAARMRELTTRMALGASRARITGQLLVESSVITLAGGAARTRWPRRSLAQALLAFLATNDNLVYRLDTRVLLFTLIASVLDWRDLWCRAGAADWTRPADRGAHGALAHGRPWRRGLRKTLIVAQMALTLLLLMAADAVHADVDAPAGARRIRQRSSVDVPRRSGRGGHRRAARRADDARDRFNRCAASLASSVPRSPTPKCSAAVWRAARMTISFAHSGERFVTDRAALVMRVGPGFFSTLGTPVIAGRDFDERDVRAPGAKPTRSRTAIVSENFVRRYFKDRHPIGARIGRGNQPDTIADAEIIGVIKDFSRSTLRDDRVGAGVLSVLGSAVGQWHCCM